MRPFSTLGVKPFLQASDSDLQELQSLFYKKSRELHPDRFLKASDEERERAESLSAQLNADYAALRDFWKRLSTTLAHNTSLEGATQGSLPPELAAEYFELQEEASNPAQWNAFESRVQQEKEKAIAVVEDLTQRFPYQGVGDSEYAPWRTEDLAALQKALHSVRYFTSFLNDIQKHRGVSRAGSN